MPTQRVQGWPGGPQYKQFVDGCCPPAILPSLDPATGDFVPNVQQPDEGIPFDLDILATNLDDAPAVPTVEFYQPPGAPPNAEPPPTVNTVTVTPGAANNADLVTANITAAANSAGDVWYVRLTNACGCCAFTDIVLQIQQPA
jgi:hypothetical protein